MITEIKLQNPDATEPLVINLDIICNTPEEKILNNVLINSRKCDDWMKIEPEQDHTAIICGSAPSLGDYIREIRKAQYAGAKLFALNGACTYLNSHGIIPDYQVIMDAQPETISLIGMAEEYLFASQVDPSLFDKVPNARLWHCTFGNKPVDEQDGFPVHDDDYCLVGASATVGNTSLGLTYVMGFRQLDIYGMDSSHRDGKGHVSHQKMNEGDPCTIVHFHGKQYTSSFTMKLQADYFISRAKQLEDVGCTINVHGDGLLPAMWYAPCNQDVKADTIPTDMVQPITVAFLWRGEHPNAVPTIEYAPKMLASIRKYLPTAHVIQLTYPDFQALDGVDEVFRMEEVNDRHIWACEAFTQIVERGQPVLFIGTDVILQSDVSNVFNLDFDIASSRYPTYTRDDGVFCWDVQSAKPSAAGFYRDMARWYVNHTSRDMEEDGQTSFTALAEESAYNVLSLDFNDYCFTPESQDEDVSKAAIVHYRGGRKKWM